MDTETIIRKIKENKVVAIATAVIVLIIIVLLIKSFAVKGPVPETGPITVTGEFTCLPYEDGVKEKDCVLGVKEDGNYYAADWDSISLAVTGLEINDKIVVTGNFLPISQISDEKWKKFKIAGLITVEALTRGK
jgi:hypothetical protein